MTSPNTSRNDSSAGEDVPVDFVSLRFSCCSCGDKRAVLLGDVTSAGPPVCARCDEIMVVDRVLVKVSPPKSQWMTPRQAASYLRITPKDLRSLTSRRQIPFSRRGRILRYRCDLLDRWLNGATR